MIDFILVNLSFYLGYATCLSTWEWKSTSDHNWLHIITINLVWYLSSHICRLYNNIFIREAIPTIKVTIKSLFVFGTIMLLLVNNIKEFTLSPYLFIISYIIFNVLLINWKLFFLIKRRPRRNSLIDHKPVVIVGAGKNGIELFSYLTKNPNLGYNVVGFLKMTHYF